MAHGDLAQLAAVVGGAGSALLLLAYRRLMLFAGFALLAAAEGGLVLALVPRTDLDHLASPLGVAALAFAVLAVATVAAVLVRYPALVPPLVLLAAPFRVPVDLGSQHAFLLLPLYGVLAAASLALLYRLARGEPVAALPLVLAAPAAALIGFAALSLVWSRDLQQGSIELVFFVFPFAALVAVVARAPFAAWLPRALATIIVGLSCVFAAIGLYQAWTHTLFFAQDLRVANAYTTFFRVTSVFKDPSLYGRHLVLAISMLLVALWLRRLRFAYAAPPIALLWAGLYFSYSQSSMAVLFTTAIAITLVLGDRTARRVVAVAAATLILTGAGVAAAIVHGDSARRATSGRSRLVAVTTVVIRHHPVVGVGIGGQPQASRDEAKTRLGARKNASHTTPLTVAAELGAVGFAAYVAFLAGAGRLLLLTVRRRRDLGLGLATGFLVLFLHSLFYSGFFEDPITWGILAVAAASLACFGARAAVLDVEGGVVLGPPAPGVDGGRTVTADDIRGPR